MRKRDALRSEVCSTAHNSHLEPGICFIFPSLLREEKALLEENYPSGCNMQQKCLFPSTDWNLLSLCRPKSLCCWHSLLHHSMNPNPNSLHCCMSLRTLVKTEKGPLLPKTPKPSLNSNYSKITYGLARCSGRQFSTGRLKETSLCFKEIIFTKDLKQKCSQGWNQGLRSYDLYTFRNPKQDRKDLCFQLQQSRWAWRHNNP